MQDSFLQAHFNEIMDNADSVPKAYQQYCVINDLPTETCKKLLRTYMDMIADKRYEIYND
jgi:hypothetical protein